MAEIDPGLQADRIDEIARRLDRLTISRRDPDAFFEERSELVDELRKEAWKLRRRRSRRTPLDTGTR